MAMNLLFLISFSKVKVCLRVVYSHAFDIMLRFSEMEKMFVTLWYWKLATAICFLLSTEPLVLYLFLPILFLKKKKNCQYYLCKFWIFHFIK